MAVTVRDVVWLAGLLEGEGSFFSYRNSPTISVNMTDKDVVEKAAALLRSKVYTCNPGSPDRKIPYSATAHGSIAISWMMSLYQFMGERRKINIKDTIDAWKSADSRPKTPRGGWWGASCHPERKVYCKGLCESCYDKMKRSAESPEARERRIARCSAGNKRRRERDMSLAEKEIHHVCA